MIFKKYISVLFILLSSFVFSQGDTCNLADLHVQEVDSFLKMFLTELLEKLDLTMVV